MAMAGAVTRAGGVMAVWNDLELGHEAQFEAWYQRQHVPERLGIPGFLEARRYVAIDGESPRYCAFYWLDDVAVLASPAYLQRLARPTETTRQMMPRFRAMCRTPCTVLLDHGAGIGDIMTWIACMSGDPTEAPVDVLQAILVRGLDCADVTGLQLWQCDRRMAALENPEQRLRVAPDEYARWMVFVEGTRASGLKAYRRALCEAIRAALDGTRLTCSPAYRLLASLRADDAPDPCADSDLSAARTPAV